jgi:hypothetical protein
MVILYIVQCVRYVAGNGNGNVNVNADDNLNNVNIV